jgi:hypothetical protein
MARQPTEHIEPRRSFTRWDSLKVVIATLIAVALLAALIFYMNRGFPPDKPAPVEGATEGTTQGATRAPIKAPNAPTNKEP